MALFRIGNVHRHEGRYPKALEYYEKSLAIRTKAGDEKGQGATLNNLGLVHQDLHKHDKALECYEKALAIYNRTADFREQGVTLSIIANLYSDLGDHPAERWRTTKSPSLSRESLAISRAKPSP